MVYNDIHFSEDFLFTWKYCFSILIKEISHGVRFMYQQSNKDKQHLCCTQNYIEVLLKWSLIHYCLKVIFFVQYLILFCFKIVLIK